MRDQPQRLTAMVKDGGFRADLYYRLNAAAVTVPPLRERRDGIPAMVAYFIECHGRAFAQEHSLHFARRAGDRLCLRMARKCASAFTLGSQCLAGDRFGSHFAPRP